MGVGFVGTDVRSQTDARMNGQFVSILQYE